jgi:general stress protein 26
MTAVAGVIPSEVMTYLDLHHVITLSTASFTGMPHAATVVFANDDQRLYFSTFPDSILARNIRDNRHVSFTVDDYTTDWRKVRELQGVGGCAPAAAGDESTVLRIAQRKMGRDYKLPTGTLYAVTPFEMHFVDYSYDVVFASAPEVSDRMIRFDDSIVPTRGAVATELGRIAFEPGQVIFRPGSGNGQYYVVIEGEVEVRAEGHGADQTVIRVGVGQMFGDQAALRGQTGQLTAHAVTRTVVLAVQREAIRDMAL